MSQPREDPRLGPQRLLAASGCLEEDRFIWPSEAVVPMLTVEQLHRLLEGIDIAVVKRRVA